MRTGRLFFLIVFVLPNESTFMPSIEPANGALVWPAWSDASKRARISVWPQPDSGRIDGRMRWAATNDVQPIASRYYGRFAWGPATVTAWQYYWWDVTYVADYHFKGSSGLSASGNDFDFEIQYLDVLPNAGTAGILITTTMRVVPDPPAVRTEEWPISVSLWFPTIRWDLIDPARAFPPWGFATFPGAFGLKRVEWIPISECFPMEEVTVT